MHINLTDIYQLDELQKHDSFTATCETCGKEYTIHDYRPEPDRIERYRVFLCQPCYARRRKKELYGEHLEIIVAKSKKTYKEKTGYDNPMQNPEVQAKLNKTMDRDYGGRGYASPIIRKKCEETNERVNGDPHYSNQEKREQTMIDTYGVPYAMWNEELKQKRADSDRNNPEHGGMLYSQTDKHKELMRELNAAHPEWAEKSAKTMFDTYGMWWNQTEEAAKMRAEHPEWEEMANEAIIAKYGMNYSQTEEYKTMMRSMRAEHPEWKEKATECLRQDMFENPDKYNHGPIICGRVRSRDASFDSIPEFYVYRFCVDHWIPIIRNKTLRLSYLDRNGKTHYTTPDFIINGMMVEIKGGHFYNDDGTWKFPYNKKKVNGEWVPMTSEEKEYMDDLYERKRQCLLSHGVLILKDSDPWVQYCSMYSIFKYNVMDYMLKYSLYVGLGFTPFNTDFSKEYTDFTEIGKTPFDMVLENDD